MYDITLSFFIVGFISLAVNTIKDIRTRKVDSLKNYLCLGAAIMVVSQYRPGIWYILGLLLFIGLVRFAGRKLLAAGDLEALGWIMLGFGAIDLMLLGLFLVALITMLMVYHGANKVFSNENYAGYPAITSAYALVMVFLFIGWLSL